MPPEAQEGEQKYGIELIPSIHKVAKYTNQSFQEVLELPFDFFLQCLKNQVVNELMEMEEGREYLKKCERFNTTEPDLDALHKKFKR